MEIYEIISISTSLGLVLGAIYAVYKHLLQEVDKILPEGNNDRKKVDDIEDKNEVVECCSYCALPKGLNLTNNCNGCGAMYDLDKMHEEPRSVTFSDAWTHLHSGVIAGIGFTLLKNRK